MKIWEIKLCASARIVLCDFGSKSIDLEIETQRGRHLARAAICWVRTWADARACFLRDQKSVRWRQVPGQQQVSPFGGYGTIVDAHVATKLLRKLDELVAQEQAGNPRPGVPGAEKAANGDA